MNKIIISIIGVVAIMLSISSFASPGKKGHDDKKSAPVASEAVGGEEADEVLTPKSELEGEDVIKMSDGLAIPKMDPERGKLLFVSKGCVACHAVNGIGGEDAPSLDATTMHEVMNPFDMAARMWRGAPAMIYAQEESMEGGQILFTGRELADIIAFLHSKEVQENFSKADLSPEALEMLEEHAEGEAH